ncbi:MAG: transposase [Rhodospirillaceae bacterium]|nr:transposase [Rhodospirillaceae bacterium]
MRDLDRAFKNFFDGRARFPSWRNATDNNSFTVPAFKNLGNDKGWHMNTIFGKDSIKLPKIGRIHYRKHKRMRGKLKTVTVIREGKNWYICASAAIEIAEPANILKPAIGVDVGVTLPLARSDGQALPKDDGLVKLDKRKRRLQRELSRRDKQSNRRKKSREKAARVSRHIAARRKARLHQVTTDLVRNFSLIAIEDLKVGNMTASAKGDADAPGRNVKAKAGLNREILNVAPFMFRTLLEYKTAAAGVELIDVAPHHTSQTCNACGVVDAASRQTQSKFICTHCGHVENADVNAAKNILSKALTSRGSAAVATRRKTPSDPYSRQLGTGTATLNPTVSPLWTRIAPHFSSLQDSKSGGAPDGYP